MELPKFGTLYVIFFLDRIKSLNLDMKNFALAILFMLNGCIICFAQNQVKFATFELAGDSMLNWKCNESKNSINYIIQQYRWNRWVDWDTLRSIPGKDSASYSFNINKYVHTGLNKFRVRAVNELVTMLSYSKAVSFTSSKAKARDIAKHYSIKNHIIDFGRQECFELYSKDGKLIKKGYTQMVGVAELIKGSYYLNYDNINAEFNFK